MPAATATLNLIKARFGGRDALIESAYRTDPQFRSMCTDYHDCQAALDRLPADDSPSAATRRGEYTELLEELGCEIREWLAGHDGG